MSRPSQGPMPAMAWCGIVAALGALACGGGGAGVYEHRLAFASDNEGNDASVIFDDTLDRKYTWTGSSGVDRLGDGLRFGFVEPLFVDELQVRNCRNGGPADLVVYANGVEVGRARVESRTPDWRDWGPTNEPTKVPIGRSLQSLYLSFEGPIVSPSVCVFGIDLVAGGKRLAVGLPRAVKAVAKASSTLEPEHAYRAGYAFDGRFDYAWIEGAAELGAGEYLEAQVAEPIEVHKVEIWSGFQRSNEHFHRNGRPRALGLSVDGGEPIPLALEEHPGSQEIVLPAPVRGSTFRFVVGDGVTEDDPDLAISEIALWDADGPVKLVVDLGDAKPHSRHPVAHVGNQWLVDACAGHRRGLKLRDSRTFVYVERAADAVDADLTLVFDGAWGEGADDRGFQGITLHGRERVGEKLPYYFEPSFDAQDTSKMRGAKMKLALASQFSASAWENVVGELPASCPEAADHAAMLAAGALVARGGSIEGVFVPRPLHATELAYQYHSVDLELPGSGTFDCKGTTWVLDGATTSVAVPEAQMEDCRFERDDATAKIAIVPGPTRERVVCSGVGEALTCVQSAAP